MPIALAAIILVVAGKRIEWVNCAREGEICPIPDGQTTLMRVSSASGVSFYREQNGPSFCGNRFFSLVPPGGDVNCSYALHFDDSDGVDKIRWVSSQRSFPAGWFIFDDIAKVRCSYGGKESDIWTMGLPGRTMGFHLGKHMNCEVSPPGSNIQVGGNSSVPFETCATEGQDCILPPNTAGYIVRYGNLGQGTWDGYPGNFVYLNITGMSSIPCNGRIFGNPTDHSPVPNYCQMRPLTLFFAPVGHWVNAQALVAADGGQIEQRIEWGVTSTSTEATTNTWANTLTETIGVELAFGDVTVSSSISMSESYSLAKLTSRAVTKSKQVWRTVSCDVPPGKTVTMFQWVVSANEYLDLGYPAAFNIFSQTTICVEGTKAPKCLPNMCAEDDPSCQTCKQ